MLNYPERVALAGLLTYAVLWLVAPLEIVFPVSWQAMGFIALCYAAFFLGIFLVTLLPKMPAQAPNAESHASYSRGFWLFAVLGAIGISLRFYDKLFVRGASLAETALESREILADVEAGPLSVIGGALYPFCYVPLIIWLCGRAVGDQPRLRGWIAGVLFLLPALDALLLLSRSQMLVAMGMMYASIACVVFYGNPFHRRLLLPVAAGLVFILGISVFTFFERIDQMGVDVLLTIFESAYGSTLTPDSNAKALLGAGEGASLIFQSLIPILQYYLHGVFEFGLLWTRQDAQPLTMGWQTFSPYIKLLTMLGVVGRDLIDLEAAYSRIGIFTTFFGPVWTDFGWFGPFFMMVFGIIAKLVSRRALAGEAGAYPLHAFIVVVIFFMPVVNFLVSAQGMYVVNAFVIYWVYSKYSGKLFLAGILGRNHPRQPV